VDQSPAVQALVAGYGGSDSTLPNFNRPQYVRFASIHDSRDLGQIPAEGVVLDGLVGAQSGTQTLFFRFHSPQPARIGLRRVLLNPYTDQYIALGLRGPDGLLIPVQPDAPPTPPGDTFRLVSDGGFSNLAEGYARNGYWDEGGSGAPPQGHVEDGYWDDDYSVIDFGGGYSVVDLKEGEDLILVPPVISLEFGAAQEVDSLAIAAAEQRPPGIYTVTVSSSQWPQLPFRLQLLVRADRDLRGVADFTIQGTGRLLFDLGGVAAFRIDAVGRLARLYILGAATSLSYSAGQYWDDGYAIADGASGETPNPQVADFTIKPTAKVQRLSPSQGAFF